MQAFVRRRSASAPDSGPLSGLGRAHGDSGQLHKDTMIHTHALTVPRPVPTRLRVGTAETGPDWPSTRQRDSTAIGDCRAAAALDTANVGLPVGRALSRAAGGAPSPPSRPPGRAGAGAAPAGGTGAGACRCRHGTGFTCRRLSTGAGAAPP